MAGKRQHYVPQALQRGFVSRWRGENAYTWVYRKGVEPFETNIKNAAVEKHFYVDGDGVEADSEITRREGNYGEVLEHIRTHGEVESISPDRLAEMVAHFEVRTRNLRENFKYMSGFLADQFFSSLEDPEVVERFVRHKLESDSTFLEENIGKALRENGLRQEQIDVILSNKDKWIELVFPQLRDSIREMVGEIRAQLPEILETSTKTGHVSALKEAVSPESKVERYRQLAFFVMQTGSVGIPLGDSITVFVSNAGESISSFCDGGKEFDCLLVPVSENQVLVGGTGEYEPDAEEIPGFIARVSCEQFIAGEDAFAYRCLTDEIGKDVELLGRDRLLEIVWRELRSADETIR